MTNRLHEGITSTQSPRRDVTPLRLASLFLLAAVLLLALGWAVFSPLDEAGQRQAQAQTTPEGGPGGNPDDEEDELSYEAFGDKKDPFVRVVQQANEGGEDNDGVSNGGNNGEDINGDESNSQPQSDGDRGEESDSQTQSTDDEVEDQDRATSNDENGSRSGNGDEDAQQRTQSSAPPANSGAANVVEAENVNCQDPEDDFERLLCEDAAASGTGGTGGSGADGPGEIEDDRDGGSGRSGAGEPTETFRNGGPAPMK